MLGNLDPIFLSSKSLAKQESCYIILHADVKGRDGGKDFLVHEIAWVPGHFSFILFSFPLVISSYFFKQTAICLNSPPLYLPLSRIGSTLSPNCSSPSSIFNQPPVTKKFPLPAAFKATSQ